MPLTASHKPKKGPDLAPYQILLRPLVTEKGTEQANATNSYSFEVHPLADKPMIRHAVEQLFRVRVEAVRTQNRHGKPRRHKQRKGKTQDWKKAIVTLHADDKISFF